MKKVVMLGLMMVLNWSQSCSIEPSPESLAKTEAFNAASIALLKARVKQQPACKRGEECIVYNKSPKQILPLLQKVYDAPFYKSGNDWLFIDEAHGLTVRLTSLGKSSQVTVEDRETAYDKILVKLYKLSSANGNPDTSRSALNSLLGSCRGFGLEDANYQLKQCNWKTTNETRRILFNVVSASDKSLPAGKYIFFIDDFCGFSSLEGPKK